MSKVDSRLQRIRLEGLGESRAASRVDKVLECSRPSIMIEHPKKSSHFCIQDSPALLLPILVDQLALGYTTCYVLCWQN